MINKCIQFIIEISKELQETRSLHRQEISKEKKLGKQDFHYDMEEVFEPVTAKQGEATENQKQNHFQIQQQAEKQVRATEGLNIRVRGLNIYLNVSNNPAINCIEIYTTQSNREYKNMMKLRIEFKFLPTYSIQIQLILVSLR